MVVALKGPEDKGQREEAWSWAPRGDTGLSDSGGDSRQLEGWLLPEPLSPATTLHGPQSSQSPGVGERTEETRARSASTHRDFTPGR